MTTQTKRPICRKCGYPILYPDLPCRDNAPTGSLFDLPTILARVEMPTLDEPVAPDPAQGSLF